MTFPVTILPRGYLETFEANTCISARVSVDPIATLEYHAESHGDCVLSGVMGSFSFTNNTLVLMQVPDHLSPAPTPAARQ